jgi:uncharacterized protein
MHPDLERVVRLQQIETFCENARRRISERPDRIRALDTRLATAQEAVDRAHHRLAENQSARRTCEKDLAAVQSRLAKFKDQVMEVKTNREYQAMQKEIEVAQSEVRRIEDLILDRMIEAEDLGQDLKRAGQDLAADQAAVRDERRALEDEATGLEDELERMSAARQTVMAEMPAHVFAVFEQVAKGRRGIAVAEARDGHCTLCNVRLRPQVFNEVRKNDSFIQCDSCQRILYFVHPAASPADRAEGQ